jgi:dTMP kinase
MDALTEAYLYAAARADHVRGEIWPRLQRREWVVCERFLDSSLAYQGRGRGIGMDEVGEINRRAVEGLLPDRTFYLRLDASERERRARQSGGLDRLEKTGAGFMCRVEEGFEELARLEPERIVSLDATAPPKELAGRVEKEILELADL